ncbi:MAG: fluoride efflux transporter CrcB [Saprospiraceae bacterium]|jgi:CrcB protein
MKAILLIGIGGGFGSILRYGIGVWSQKIGLAPFPLGTVLVNLIGSLLIGLIYGWMGKQSLIASQEVQFLAITGFCGGFTTYSAFSYDTLILIEKGHYSTAIGYVLVTLLAGWSLVYLGYLIIQKI